MHGTISINSERCLNNQYQKVACQHCRDQCPAGCFDDLQTIDLRRCNECGLCLAACRAEAISGINFSRKAFENMLPATDSPLVLSCQRQGDKNIWPCLGFLDARLLITLVCSAKNNNRKVVVDDRLCLECKPEVAAHLRELLEEVGVLLAKAGKSPILDGQAVSMVKPQDKVISRRSFFTTLLGKAINVVSEAVVSARSGEPLPRQQLFKQHVAKLKTNNIGLTKLFYGLTIEESCRACGLCARKCPNKAITIEDYGYFIEVSHTPQECIGCGICVAYCPQQAMALRPASGLEQYLVARCLLPRCTGCGDLYQSSSNQALCLTCSLQQSTDRG